MITQIKEQIAQSHKKTLFFRAISLILVFTHLFQISAQGISFAQVPRESNTKSTLSSEVSEPALNAEFVSNDNIKASASAPLMAKAATLSSGYVSSVPPVTLQAAVGLNASVLQSFQNDIFTGRATLSIPIAACSGRKGIQPNISLNYSSGSGNSFLGVGWSLELGSIERSIKKGLPAYGPSDTYIFNSGSAQAELCASAAGEYRFKIEGAFIKLSFDGTYWQAKDKSGSTYIYGQDSSHRIESGGKIFKWCLQRVTDIFGNYMTIDYIKDAEQIYPYQVKYAGNSPLNLLATNLVEFSYSDRADKMVSYRSAFKIETRKLLSDITVYAVAVRQRRYHFEYQDNSTGIRSLLKKIIEYGRDDSLSMPAISFEYKYHNLGWDSSSIYLPAQAQLGPFSYLADVNNDGYIDILRHYYLGDYQYVRHTFLGNINGWSETSDWYPPEGTSFGWPAETLRDNGARLVDVNGDGWVDIVNHEHSTRSGCNINTVFLNNKRNGWVRDDSWRMPEDTCIILSHDTDVPMEWREYFGVVFMDVNADGYVDIVISRGGQRYTYINTHSGWQRDANWSMPDGDLSNGSTQFGDLNADGLIDFMILDGSAGRAYLNSGSGWVREPSFDPPAGNFSDGSTELIDINEDGFSDLVIASGSERRTLLNTAYKGNHWQEVSGLALPEGSFSNYGTRLNDTKGKNTPDLLFNPSSERRVYLNKGREIDYLTNISNGLGGAIEISYKSSVQYDNTGGDGISDLPFPIQTVESVTTDDGGGNTYTARYEYKNGLFDFDDREFRGFGYVRVIDAEGNYNENYFKQDNIFKGRIYLQEAKDNQGNLYTKTENTWDYLEPCPGVYFPYLEEANNYIFDGASSNKQTCVKFEYDAYGNPTKVNSEGEAGLNGDEKTQITEYTYNFSDWILSCPKHTYLLDANQNKVSEKWFYYDFQLNLDAPPSKGLLTKEETLLSNPLTTNQERVSAAYSYDPYGNLTSSTDSLGRTTTIIYDSTYYAYPIQVINAKGQAVRTIYYAVNEPAQDAISGFGLFGQVKYTQDCNNQKTYNIYDGLGRLIKVITPNDSEDFPAVTYSYYLPPRKSNNNNNGNNNLFLRFSGTEGSTEFTDETGKSITSFGDTHIDTSQYKSRPGSGFFDGYQDYLSLADSDDWSFGAQDFTIDFWVRFNSLEHDQVLIGQGISDYTYWKFVKVEQSHVLIFVQCLNGVIEGYYRTAQNPEWKENSWQHVALVRKGNNCYIFLDGKLLPVIETVRWGALSNLSANLLIGASRTTFPLYFFNGWLDELRVTKGLARWTEDFDLENKGEFIKITKNVKGGSAAAPEYLTSYQFIDGLGRVVQTKTPAQNSPQTGQARQVISDIVKFDQRGQVKEKYLPYFVDASDKYETPLFDTPHATFSYDCLGRLIHVENPDLTSSSVSYSGWVKTVTDEAGHNKTEYSDAYGRTIKIEEHNGTQVYTTTYEYDNLGNLSKVIDDQGNITQIYYDSLGRKIRMDDADMGVWAYEYDKVGNLIKQTDAKGQVLEFTYDLLNRLISKKCLSQTLASYSYDDISKQYCLGRLSKITDLSGSTEFFYDNLGREVKSIKVVGGLSFAVERSYDSLDRLVNLKYPDGEVLTYSYNPQGITSITGQTSIASKTYIANINYSCTGQITKIQYGNGAQTNYAYDPNSLRLTNLITQSTSGRIQDLSYQFDSVGNITGLIDSTNTASQSFLYDDLNRLIQASGSYGTFTYNYDSIGNMLNKEGVNLSYGRAGRLVHAVTRYGDSIIDYDANGNMIRKGSLELAYDAENRLIRAESASLPVIPQQASVTVTLKPGWNFISLPLLPNDARISALFSAIAAKFDQVSRYNASTRKFEHYCANPKYDQFSQLEYGRGYQIYITGSSNVTLSISGTLPTTNQCLSLKSGVNLVFTPKTQNTNVELALSQLTIGVDYSKVLYYNKALGKFQEYSGSKKEFTQLIPGNAYYLYCLKDANWIIPGSGSTTSVTNFVYDGDGGRVKKLTGSSSTIYIGSLFEKDSSNKTSKHIFAGSQRVCTVTKDEARGTTDESYYHPDHLGSSNVITDSSGNKAERYEYTPYGSSAVSEIVSRPSPLIHHKFTGKELDNTGLYFYGARYYDPQLGRFISADTIVQSPYDPQSLNRYSYCRNNPINYIDPSGNFWFIPFIIAAIKGAIVGALIGGAIAAVTGQNIGQGFLTGAISGAIFGGVGSLGLKGLAHTAAHFIAGAASGAASGAITGDDIGMNALIGGLSAGVSERLGNFGPLKDVVGTNLGAHLTNMLRRAFIGSVVGGAASAATGGSFGYGAKQGAMTSAIAYTANEALHEAGELAQKALNTQQEPKPTRDINNSPKKDSTAGQGNKTSGGLSEWIAKRLKVDTTNKHFSSSTYWATYMNSLVEGSKGILVGLIVTGYGPFPFDVIAGGLTGAATTQMAVDTYRNSWLDNEPYDGIPEIRNAE